ncbi:MAG: hypothetical protein OXC99_08185 [Chloroflexi bacterium]|nr:hypothetical protein [Chloroflexota bacterium]
MQKVFLGTLLVVLMAALFAGGLIIGLGVHGPDVTALRAETAEQKDELTSLQARLSGQESQVASLKTELSDVSAERSGLSVSLDASRSTVRDMEADTARLSSDLRNAQIQLDRTENSLESAEERSRKLQVEVLSLMGSQRDLTMAISLLEELQLLNNGEFGPNHGDAQLLVEEGHRAANNDNYGEAAKFFGESSKAFDLAKTNVAEVTTKSEELVDLVPEDLNRTFVESHRQARSTVFAMEAQARTYQAADYLYTIIDEWVETENPTRSDRARWGELADMAEDQFEMAMSALDEADTWSPGLWRRTEAIRLNTRDWRNLMLGIRFNIIDVQS